MIYINLRFNSLFLFYSFIYINNLLIKFYLNLRYLLINIKIILIKLDKLLIFIIYLENIKRN